MFIPAELQTFAMEGTHVPRCKSSGDFSRLWKDPPSEQITFRNTAASSPVSARGISVTRCSLTKQTATYSNEQHIPKQLTLHTSELPRVGRY